MDVFQGPMDEIHDRGRGDLVVPLLALCLPSRNVKSSKVQFPAPTTMDYTLTPWGFYHLHEAGICSGRAVGGNIGIYYRGDWGVWFWISKTKMEVFGGLC